jgi:hypothetical protein
MNYTLHYEKLITRGQTRILENTEYSEKHHIVPKCMGGTNHKNNLVALLPEEHLIAHLLLTRIHPNEPKLLFAADMMTNRKTGNNKNYGWVKRKLAIVRREMMLKQWEENQELREQTIKHLTSIEMRKIQREAAIANWKDPDIRERITRGASVRHTKQWTDPSFREKTIKAMSVAAKNNWNDPDYTIKALCRLEHARQSIDVEKISAMASIQVLEDWKNPEYRKKQARARGIPVYKVTSPTGDETIVENGICAFATSFGLGNGTFQKIAKGWVPTSRSPAFGWKAEIVS